MNGHWSVDFLPRVQYWRIGVGDTRLRTVPKYSPGLGSTAVIYGADASETKRSPPPVSGKQKK